MADPVDDKTRRLLEFLGAHDAECPLCGYNLRGLTEERCPECRQELVLTVGLREVRLVWLLVSLAPCSFSGIAAVLLLVVMIANPGAPFFIKATDTFGFTSAAVGVALVVYRRWFIRLKRSRQIVFAVVIWGVHLAAFLLLLRGLLG